MERTRALPGTVIRFARDDRGAAVGWDLGGPSPHMLLVGPTGSGIASTAAVIARTAARKGLDVRFAEVVPGWVAGIEDAEGVRLAAAGTTFAERVAGACALISEAWEDMYSRFTRLEAASAEAREFRQIVLILGNEPILAACLAAERQHGPGPHPVIRQLAELLRMGRGAAISVLIAGGIVDAHAAGVMTEFGTRVALGPVTRSLAVRLFGAAAPAVLPDVSAPGAQGWSSISPAT
jgi:hypothetical protein